MSKTILITGGAASGKSRWAATHFSACDYVLYLRAGEYVDKDTLNRIEYGNKQHGVEWVIVTDTDNEPQKYFNDHKFIIFDSLGSYTSRIIDEMCPDPARMSESLRKDIEKRVINDMTDMYQHIRDIEGCIIIITVETGFSVTPENRSQAIFREILGNVNQRIANMSDEVYFSASGIQFKIK
ncbi:MAG: bifunctional adenosylcobinamide kinase/adenosylcobinamide-phosphate guanylyltransferase [Oscillospiraceae bacterium]|nr:bifunctional adenosylcobinamide kinase/adenosylcobinamide-phosphate guanylyltransferase [Oscillospiraceae bacterium]